MLIRCEKCKTLYELDESLLPPQGAPVQCSKCQFVFKAFPGSPGGAAFAEARTVAKAESAAEAPGPAQAKDGVEMERPDGASATAVGEPSEDASRGSSGPSIGARPAPAPLTETSGSSSKGQPQAARPGPPAGPALEPTEPQFTADGRPIRKVPFPTEAPAPSGRRPALERLPYRSSSSARTRRWALVVVPVALALVLAAAFVAWRMLSRRSEPAAGPRRAEGHSAFAPAERVSPVRDLLALARHARLLPGW